LRERFREPDIGEGLAEEPVDARRYVEALRRQIGLIVGLPLCVAALVFVISLALPKSFSATAQIAPSVNAVTTTPNTSGTSPNLATIQPYITSPAVLASAARQLPGESVSSLQHKITASTDTTSGLVDVTASDGNASRAARLATGVAQAFLNERSSAERAQLSKQAATLTREMSAAQSAGNSGLAAALQQQVSNVAAQAASAGADLQLVAPASVPGNPHSPRPTRAAFFALVAVLFVTVLFVAGREMLRPSIAGARDLTTLTGMPVLSRVPRVASGRGDDSSAPEPAETEAYRFLCRALELAVWPGSSRVLALTSAVRQEGRTTVVSKLGVALAEAGNRTLLVDADLRRPALHETFGLSLGSGLGGVVQSMNGRGGKAEPTETPQIPIEQVGRNLAVLTSGRPPDDPAALLTNDVVHTLVDRVRALEFDYVLFDLPPLIAAAETQLFVRQADGILLVSYVGRASAAQLSQTRELLDRLGVWQAGAVVLGVRGDDTQAHGTLISSVRARMAASNGRSAPGSEPQRASRHGPRQPR
jgi:tyrosine-protein kinase